MKSLLKSVPASIVGYVVLVVILTAGAAQSLSGSNTVYTDDIVNGQVYGGDIAANAVSGSKIYPNSVTGADVNESTLKLPGVIRATAVTSTGVKVFGAGTAARTGLGAYTVNYGIPLRNCAAHVTGGYNYANGVGIYSYFAHGTVFPGYPTQNVVSVYFYSNLNLPTDSGFFLTVTCVAGSASHTTASGTSSQSGPASGSEAPPQAE